MDEKIKSEVRLRSVAPAMEAACESMEVELVGCPLGNAKCPKTFELKKVNGRLEAECGECGSPLFVDYQAALEEEAKSEGA